MSILVHLFTVEHTFSYVDTHSHTHARAHTHTHTNGRTHARTHTHTHTHIHKWTHAHAHTCTRHQTHTYTSPTLKDALPGCPKNNVVSTQDTRQCNTHTLGFLSKHTDNNCSHKHISYTLHFNITLTTGNMQVYKNAYKEHAFLRESKCYMEPW